MDQTYSVCRAKSEQEWIKHTQSHVFEFQIITNLKLGTTT